MTRMSRSHKLTPRFIILIIAAFVIGIAIGLGVFTMTYAKGLSYLSNNPETCTNCHVMNEQYDGWIAGPHAGMATCNDCHLPHDNIVAKYAVKAENGFSHASKFTLGNYPENIVARDISKRITNDACLYCHAELTDDIRHPGNYVDDEVSCVRCHSDVGH